MTLEKYPHILQTRDTVLLKEHKGHNMSQHQQSIDLKQHTVKFPSALVFANDTYESLVEVKSNMCRNANKSRYSASESGQGGCGFTWDPNNCRSVQLRQTTVPMAPPSLNHSHTVYLWQRSWW